MSSETDYAQEYEQAEQAYLLGKYEEAAITIDSMVKKYPQDPNVRLLKADIYCNGLGEYELAREQYELVLELTDEVELCNYATNGIKQALQLQNQSRAIEQSSLDEQNFLHGENFSDGFDLDKNDLDKAEWPSLTKEQQNNGNNFDSLEEDYSGNSGDRVSFEPFLEMNVDDETLAKSKNYEENPEDETFVVINSEARGNSLDISEKNFPPELLNNEDDYDFYDDEDEEHTEIGSNKSYSRNINNKHDFDDVQDQFQEFEGIDNDSDSSASEDPSNISGDFLKEFDLFSDNKNIGELSSLGMDEVEDSRSESELLNDRGGGLPGPNLSTQIENDPVSFGRPGGINLQDTDDPNPSGIMSSSETLMDSKIEVESRGGPLATFKNAPLNTKKWYTTAAVGVTSLLAVVVVGVVARPNKSPAGLAMNALAAGLAGAGTSWFLIGTTTKHIRRSVFDLQKQFEYLYQGNFNVQATPESNDELGQLSDKFNQMARVLSTTTEEAQRRAQETEQAKEDLQRQVIRLLDDVEGAARGDLTVQAEVTADVLGAVADAFNLTIQNLREIVKQVKGAAKQVNRGAADSELFASNQYSSALNMAGELAVTLNSVQLLTDAIQRVAENAKEAEEVARTSSVTALKGGESVERTVAGIVEIRDTVAETARKVKRLAEASQEISKIVALISQISSRTNLLALNASIEAARAGESGRGFAIVADEVRQLADRSAKALKEIEQIVWQIQSETGSVMTAMEEGLQQVVDVVDRAEQAKGSLEDIIQVSKRIDTLVRSITASTVEQRENSRKVSEVMQSVELAAQTTSRESQRVASSLQNLVSISQELLSSVERFRVEATDN